ncbi:MAG: MFS transporter [Ktedonobacteraceae bacterium]|nr:MFS transporter [Ktedonobacteraceae bacterium]
MSEVSSQSRETGRQETTFRPVPLWRNRDYLLLIGGQAVSAIGSQISLVAFPLLIFALTGSAEQAGLMAAVRSLPVALFTLPAGVLVDRWDRRRLMLFCDAGRALVLGSIPVALIFGHLTSIQLYIVSFIEGTLFALFTLAEAAALPRVVAPEQLAQATSQNTLLESLAGMIGPALGPILYGLGRAVPFLSDAVSYAVSVISLLFIRTRFQREREHEKRGGSVADLWRDVREGIVWLWQKPLLRFLAIMTFGLNTPCYGYILILIVLMQNMHASNTAMGVILGASGVGSIVGSLIAGPLYKRLGFARLLIGSAWVWAVTWLLYAFAPTPLLLGVINAACFIVVPVYLVVQYTYRLSTIPDALQGRVNSVFRLIAFSGPPLGMALTGYLLQLIGPFFTVIALFIPQAVLCIIATLSRLVREAR